MTDAWVDIYEVIRTAPDQHVRTLLRLLCDDSYSTKIRTQELHNTILLLQSNGSGDSKKRTREAEVLFCLKCDDCFIEEDNHEKACAYHPGEFVEDEDFFENDDPNITGHMDDEERFKEYPEGFLMTCCDKRGNEPGCDIGRHASSKSQRARADGNGGGFDDEEEYDEDEDEEEEYDEEEDEEEEEEEGDEPSTRPTT
ncbi:hypothetical protein TWF694_011595 [Orbilia ellipsospora]|uniref:C2H2-type domain-containing protein n=1 Tax=Orbilia ellipsospora TaxID=2528407 RepID=A0AAV9XBW9_9PEZI